MADLTEMLKPSEAAVVSGVELRDVNHAIDRGILPDRLIRRGAKRAVSAEGCLYIAFYHGSANRLTAEERRFAIRAVGERVAEEPTGKRWTSLASKCLVHDEYLHIDLKPFLLLTRKRWDRFSAARNIVTRSADTLGGTPVIKGTRIPIYDVAASVAAGLPTERILSAYPGLESEHLELATLYARANPLMGRPAARPVLGGAALISEDRVARRRE